ncbi:MAG: TonB-dependent receptor [Vicinamibacterales bacterium]
MRVTKIWVVLAALLAAPALVGAQSLERGQIRGTVYDSSKAVVPKVKVTLTNTQTGAERIVESNNVGNYQFSQVQPGTYIILAEYTGFAPTTITDITVNVGSNLTLDLTLQVAGAQETVQVAAAAGILEAPTAGISQLIDAQAVASLPLSGRDYRDLAQLSSSAQVVPGLRGGIRLGGQQSDYSGLVIDGGDSFDNFFGEFFGSLETKNFTVPLDAVQEFQVVTNGFAPEFGRSTGGLLNVVTKSGTNTTRASGHYFYRGKNITADDALGTPSNIDNQHQFGGAIGMPVKKDKQFVFFAVDRQLQSGPLVTKFSRNVNGVAVPEYGIANLASLEGPHTQFQNLFTFLGRYDIQLSPRQNLSVRSFFTRNHSDGFTGGRGQNLIQAAFDNTENFRNQGHNTVATWTSVFGNKNNELKVLYSYQTRPRSSNSDKPEVQIFDTGNFGQRFFLPINGDNEKIQVQDNFVYVFGKHDMKFGGDINAYALRKNSFIGWSRGTYFFDTLESFRARQPLGVVQGFGLNGVPYEQAGSYDPAQRQTGMSLYWQDKWQASARLDLTYGVRWDGTMNPKAISATPGSKVYLGVGSDSTLGAPPQKTPADYKQFGPRLGATYRLTDGNNPMILRAAWGLYYAQTPTIFLPTGSGRTAVIFCFAPSCFPPGGFPTLWPNALKANDPLTANIGAPGINYVDPSFRNPRVSNTTLGIDYPFAANWTASVTYAYSHSDFLRTGGFSSTQWERNVIPLRVDSFGRTIVVPGAFGPARTDTSIGSAQALGSFSHGNFHQVAFNINHKFADHYQFFANYAWSNSKDNAASERDTDTFFGPQDPFNIDLDYGRNALDIPHQFKFAGVAELPMGVSLSALLIARSGVPYPAYILEDLNGDGVSNSGFSNDRPTVVSGGSSSLLERYPSRQPKFFQADFRASKSFAFKDGRDVEVLAEFFNIFNTKNLYSNPNISAVVSPTLTHIPQPGDIGPTGTKYRTLDQISPGSTPFAIQFGLRFSF